MEQQNEPVVGGVYAHFKDPAKKYVVLAIGRSSVDDGKVVIYQALYRNPLAQVWSRPFAEFTGSVERGGYSGLRFRFVGGPRLGRRLRFRFWLSEIFKGKSDAKSPG